MFTSADNLVSLFNLIYCGKKLEDLNKTDRDTWRTQTPRRPQPERAFLVLGDVFKSLHHDTFTLIANK